MKSYRDALENIRKKSTESFPELEAPAPPVTKGFMPRVAGVEVPQQTNLPIDPNIVVQKTFQSINQAKDRFKQRMFNMASEEESGDNKIVGDGFLPRPEKRPAREQFDYRPTDLLALAESERQHVTNRQLPVNFSDYEDRYNLPRGYLERTAQIESGMDPNARNPNSTAGGLFQFLDSTAEAYNLTDKFDPEMSTDAASRFAVDNARVLRQALGRDPSGAELYLAHQQGATGAARMLTAPNRLATEFVSADAVRLNGGDVNMTAGEFADIWIAKFSRG